MTDRKELELLQSRLRYFKIPVTFWIGLDGIEKVFLCNRIYDPLSAAEKMRPMAHKLLHGLPL